MSYWKTQKQYFSDEESAHTSFDKEDIEKYLESALTKYHKLRRETWWKQWKDDLRSQYPEEGTYSSLLSSEEEYSFEDEE